MSSGIRSFKMVGSRSAVALMVHDGSKFQPWTFITEPDHVHHSEWGIAASCSFHEANCSVTKGRRRTVIWWQAPDSESGNETLPNRMQNTFDAVSRARNILRNIGRRWQKVLTGVFSGVEILRDPGFSWIFLRIVMEFPHGSLYDFICRLETRPTVGDHKRSEAWRVGALRYLRSGEGLDSGYRQHPKSMT